MVVAFALLAPGGAQAAPPSMQARLQDCRERLAMPGVVDAACLRVVYSQPRDTWPRPDIVEGIAWTELGPLPPPPAHPSTEAQRQLGKRLFEEPRLSRSGRISCATCHDPQFGWGDGKRVGIGHEQQSGRRNVPSIAMAAYATHFFWDGRSPSLEHQALQPVQDPREMASTLAEMTRRLNGSKAYGKQARAAFGRTRLTAEDVARSLAAYERTLRPADSAAERFFHGDTAALDDNQLAGLHLFRTRAGCMNCHSGPTLTDNGFHNLGLHFRGRPSEDLGRYEVTHDPVDSGRFATPSLRNVSLSAPYMHNGLIPRLIDVVRFYNMGGGRPRPRPGQPTDPLFPTPDPLMKPLGLSRKEVEQLTAFLEAL